MQIILTKGLPGSGKSTWALKFVEGKPDWTRVNKDEIRTRLHGGYYSPSTELQVEDERDAFIIASLEKGLNVVVDDTNLNPKHVERIEALACEFGDEHDVEVEVTEQDFTEVSLATCIRRDSRRPNPIGADKIRDMHERYIEGDGGFQDDRRGGRRDFWRNRY
jgi:predicted kinase